VTKYFCTENSPHPRPKSTSDTDLETCTNTVAVPEMGPHQRAPTSARVIDFRAGRDQNAGFTGARHTDPHQFAKSFRTFAKSSRRFSRMRNNLKPCKASTPSARAGPHSGPTRTRHTASAAEARRISCWLKAKACNRVLVRDPAVWTWLRSPCAVPSKVRRGFDPTPRLWVCDTLPPPGCWASHFNTSI
jgi:hypothetical protein